MSLEKSTTLTTGVVATFWRLGTLVLDTATQIATLRVDGYLDSDAYTNGHDPVTFTNVSVTFVPTNALPGGVTVLTALYAKILLDPFFDGAVFTNDGI